MSETPTPESTDPSGARAAGNAAPPSGPHATDGTAPSADRARPTGTASPDGPTASSGADDPGIAANTVATAPSAVSPLDTDDAGWQPLPPQARTLFLLGGIIGWLVVGIVTLIPTGVLASTSAMPRPVGAAIALTLLVLLPAFGAWLAVKKYRHTRWRLDASGFALRRGRLWQRDTRVPISRVQHLDLKRGPLERRFGLATLVVHTAGTRHSAVALQGLDVADAERLRDRLASQIDDDDDDHA